jgi:hypothetical protein
MPLDLSPLPLSTRARLGEPAAVRLIRGALRQTGGDVRGAVRVLRDGGHRISEASLYRLLGPPRGRPGVAGLRGAARQGVLGASQRRVRDATGRLRGRADLA